MAIVPIRLKMRLRMRTNMAQAAMQVFTPANRGSLLRSLVEHKMETLMPEQHKESQGAWAPLKPDYLKWKQDSGLYSDIWMRTGAVFAAISSKAPSVRKLPHGAGAPRGKVKIKLNHKGHASKIRVDMPASMDYWQYVEQKTSRMAARPWISYRAEDTLALQTKVLTPWIHAKATHLARELQGVPLLQLIAMEAS